MVVAPVTAVTVVEVDCVDETSRAAGGFGSTGLLTRPHMNFLSRRSLLAIAAVTDIALHARPQPVSAKALAARHKLPARHLEPVLQALVRQESSKECADLAVATNSPASAAASPPATSCAPP